MSLSADPWAGGGRKQAKAQGKRKVRQDEPRAVRAGLSEIVVDEVGGADPAIGVILSSGGFGLVTVGTGPETRMYANCERCGARSATFRRSYVGDVRAKRWETQHRCSPHEATERISGQVAAGLTGALLGPRR